MEIRKIGFMGTGVMGCAMAGHLIDAGFSLKVYNRSAHKTAPLAAKGAQVCSSPRECAEDCDLVISIVGYPEDVRQVWLDESQGALLSMRAGSFALDMTTSLPSLAVELHERAAERGVVMADCPVTGGDTGARNATLTLLFGGDKECFDALQEVFSAMGRSFNHFGPAGMGQTAKACNQIAVAGTMFSVCEALYFAEKAGLDRSQIVSALGAGAAGSFSMQSYGPRIIKGDNAPGFRIEHFVKDLKIALQAAEAGGFRLPATELALKAYELLQSEGRGGEGTQALYRLYVEGLAERLRI